MLVRIEGLASARFGATGTMTLANSAHEDSASKDPAMSHALTQLSQDPRYEHFLFAPVGEDHRGASVTVLSMLARLGVEPWAEAAGLAKLPEGAARQRLEKLIEHFHDVSTPVADRGRTASGLLAFLPTQAKSARPSSDGASASLAIPPLGVPIYWIVAAALILGWVAVLAQGQ